MPVFTWRGKSLPATAPAALITEALIYPQGNGYPYQSAGGRLILGDNLAVMTALLPEFEGRLSLIYADPPFFTNRKFAARIGRNEDSRKPSEWVLSEGYADNWSDLDAYLQFLYERLGLMVRLLAPNGTLYLHLDWHADAYARLILDELLGPGAFLNEIIWAYHGPSPIRRAFNRKHDTILVYVKGPNYTFNADAVREPYNPSTVKTFASSPKAGFGKVPNLVRGKVPEDWWYFPVVARLHSERTGYPTQKPEALLERILLASSNPGDWVADFFCGSGTLPLVAARLGRQFLACDATWRAVHTTRSRLAVKATVPFTLERTDLTDWQVLSAPFQVSLEEGNILAEATAELDYWEVDPAWDGNIFRSTAQAARPERTGRLPLRLPVAQIGEKICIRFVDIHGRQFQQVLKV